MHYRLFIFRSLNPIAQNIAFFIETPKHSRSSGMQNHLNSPLFAISSSWIMQSDATECSLLEIDAYYFFPMNF